MRRWRAKVRARSRQVARPQPGPTSDMFSAPVNGAHEPVAEQRSRAGTERRVHADAAAGVAGALPAARRERASEEGGAQARN
eukprot:12978765-Alexandrium_andersonii.AAC.1